PAPSTPVPTRRASDLHGLSRARLLHAVPRAASPERRPAHRGRAALLGGAAGAEDLARDPAVHGAGPGRRHRRRAGAVERSASARRRPDGDPAGDARAGRRSRRRPLLERRAGQRLARSVDFEVCFLPREATRKPSPVAVLIDVIRASTTIVTLLDRGCSEVALVGQKDRPRLAELRAKLGALVCAEDPSGP